MCLTTNEAKKKLRCIGIEMITFASINWLLPSTNEQTSKWKTKEEIRDEEENRQHDYPFSDGE